jgi:peptidoglycan/xylan/chitin deacetylase (PgdA/CDA1 family)
LQNRLSLLIFLCAVLFRGFAVAQDLAGFYYYANQDEQFREFIWENKGDSFSLLPIAESYSAQQFTFSDELNNALDFCGDFDGDGRHEIAFFSVSKFSSNCLLPTLCPPFYTTDITVLKSDGGRFYPLDNYFSKPLEDFNFYALRHCQSADFSGDMRDDVAFVYLNYEKLPAEKMVGMMRSKGDGFEAPKYFAEQAGWGFALDSVIFSTTGDFNRDGKNDFAVLSRNGNVCAIHVFHALSTGWAAPVAYAAAIPAIHPDGIRYMAGGSFTDTAQTELMLLYADMSGGLKVLLAKAQAQVLGSFDIKVDLLPHIGAASDLLSATDADITRDGYRDVVLVADNATVIPRTQKLWQLAGGKTGFSSPTAMYSQDINTMNFHRLQHLHAGMFVFRDPIRVSRWKHRHRAALTFSFDDGYLNTVQHAKYLNQKGLRGTHNLIANDVGSGHFASWTEVLSDTGGNEYGSHSHTHAALNGLSLSAADDELRRSHQKITDAVGKRVSTFVYPYGAFSKEILQLRALRDNYLSARSSQHGYNLSTPRHPYALKSQVVVNTTTVAAVKSWIDKALQYGYWGFLMYHFIDYSGTDPDLQYYNVSSADLRAAADYAAGLDIWGDTQENVIKYIRERNAFATTHYTRPDNNSLRFFPEDGLSDTVYDVALTLCIDIPSEWEVSSVWVNDSGGEYKSDVLTDGGIDHVCIDVLPAGQEVIIRKTKHILTVPKVSVVLSNLQLFPNPASDVVRLSLPATTGMATVRVYDLRGAIVLETVYAEASNITLNTTPLLPGTYIVSVQTEKGRTFNNKLFITR